MISLENVLNHVGFDYCIVLLLLKERKQGHILVKNHSFQLVALLSIDKHVTNEPEAVCAAISLLRSLTIHLFLFVN